MPLSSVIKVGKTAEGGESDEVVDNEVANALRSRKDLVNHLVMPPKWKNSSATQWPLPKDTQSSLSMRPFNLNCT